MDPIIGLNEAYAKDDFPHKVIVGVGAYRDDAGKPYVLPCVREAERRMLEANLDMEYSGIVSSNVLRARSNTTTDLFMSFAISNATIGWSPIFR